MFEEDFSERRELVNLTDTYNFRAVATTMEQYGVGVIEAMKAMDQEHVCWQSVTNFNKPSIE